MKKMLSNHSKNPDAAFRPFDELRPCLEQSTPKSDNPAQHNATITMAAGLKELYRRATRCKNESIQDFTDAQGNLIADENLPMLAGRYQFIRAIGKGTFSQLIEAKDTFHPSKRHVAIKVMNANLAEIGIQESRCIGLLNSTDPLDSTHVVRMYNTFSFGAHFCLVLELLHSTLIEHIFAELKRVKDQLIASQPPPTNATPPPLVPTTSNESNTSSKPAMSTPKKRELQDLELQATKWRPLREKRRGKQMPDDILPQSKKEKRDSASPINVDENRNAPPPTKQITQVKNEPQSLQQLQQEILQEIQQQSRAQDQPLLPMWFIRSIASQLIASVGYLYQKGMIHADLKPENILFRDNPYVNGEFREPYVKICDFGNAIALGNIQLYYKEYEVQSLSYRAPEVICGVPFGLEIDMWSIGCILAEMCNGKLLFPYQDKNKILHKMTRMLGALPEKIYAKGQNYNSLFVPNCGLCKQSTHFLDERFPDPFIVMKNFMHTNDFVFVDLIVQLLHYDPKKRPTPQQALLHPFFAPLFTFSIFGDAQLGTEIRRIHHAVNVKAMNIYQSKNSEIAKIEPRKGCILFDEDPHTTEDDTCLPNTCTTQEITLRRENELAQSELVEQLSRNRKLKEEIDKLRTELASQPPSKRVAAELEKEIKRLSAELEKSKRSKPESKESKAEVAELEKENKRLRAELESSKRAKFESKESKNGSQEVSELRRALEAKQLAFDLESTEKTRELQKTEEEVYSLRERLRLWNEEKIQLVGRENTLLKSKTELEKDNKRLRTDCQALSKENTSFAALVKSAQSKTSSMESECDKLRNDLGERNEGCLELTAKLAVQENEANKTITHLKKELARRLSEVSNAQEQAELLERRATAEREANAKKITAITKESERMKEKLAEKTAEMDNQKREKEKVISELQADVKQKEIEVNKTKEKKATIKKSYKEAQERVQALQQEVAKAEETSTQLDKIQKEKAQLQKDQKKKETELKKLKTLVEKKDSELADKGAQIKELQEEKEKGIAENEKARTQLAALQETVESRDKKLAEKTKREKAEKEAERKEAEEKARELEEMKRESEEQQNEIAEWKKRYEQLQKESDKAIQLHKKEAELQLRDYQLRLDRLTSPPHPSTTPYRPPNPRISSSSSPPSLISPLQQRPPPPQSVTPHRPTPSRASHPLTTACASSSSSDDDSNPFFPASKSIDKARTDSLLSALKNQQKSGKKETDEDDIVLL